MDADAHIPPAAPVQESVGTILRRRRESSSLSLHDAEEATKISKNYLLALEEDRHEEFPSPVYLKGFLKNYATWLGLQEEELTRLTTLSGMAPPADPVSAARGFSGFSDFNWQRLALPAVLLGALIVSSFFVSPSEPPRTRSAITPQHLPATVPAAPTAVQPIVSSTVNKPAAEPANLPAPGAVPSQEAQVAAPRPAQTGVLVSIKVLRNCAVSVALDDGVAQSYDLAGGDLIEWKAARTVALDISDAGSVEIELNGSPLKLQAPAGKQTYIVLDATGLRH